MNAAKCSMIFDEIFQAKAKVENIFEGEMFMGEISTIFLHIVCDIILNSE